ncbi:MAG: hypothetical protein LC659_08250, partial [Myxococcales bacterium]|nr:hypothetical protein [Myxococcales bacterium]
STQLVGTATRPATAGGGPFGSQITDPSDFTWTSDNAADAGVFPIVGITPIVKFPTPGTRTLTLTVVDQYGEAGTATVTINVAGAPTTLTAKIVQPAVGTSVCLSCTVKTITLVGTSAGGSPSTVLTWTITSPAGAIHLIPGVRDGEVNTFDLCADGGGPGWCVTGDYTVTLTANDGANRDAKSVTVNAFIIK